MLPPRGINSRHLSRARYTCPVAVFRLTIRQHGVFQPCPPAGAPGPQPLTPSQHSIECAISLCGTVAGRPKVAPAPCPTPCGEAPSGPPPITPPCSARGVACVFSCLRPVTTTAAPAAAQRVGGASHPPSSPTSSHDASTRSACEHAMLFHQQHPQKRKSGAGSPAPRRVAQFVTAPPSASPTRLGRGRKGVRFCGMTRGRCGDTFAPPSPRA